MSNLKKIPKAELKLGMYLYALAGSWAEHPFWRSKFVIKDPNDILLIEKSNVQEAWIDLEQSGGARQVASQVGSETGPVNADKHQVAKKSSGEAPSAFPVFAKPEFLKQ